MAFLLGGRSGEHYGSWSDALRQRPECRLDPTDTATQRGTDRQDAQQHGLQGAGWTGLRASRGIPGTGGYERDLEGHPPETRSASDPGTRQTFPETGD